MSVAMWSGPRNISTAMMRAWENRSDTTVVDEPFYAHYLAHTGIDHPMRDDIIAAGDTDWQRVAEKMSRPPDSGVLYQKHITTHMLPHISLDWLSALHHVFLIRDPRYVVASYSNKRNDTSADDLGYTQQHHVFDVVTTMQGKPPLVIDSTRFLSNPKVQLTTVCRSLGIAFDASMLSWPAGVRHSDGVWHQHWYDAVKASTGFQAPRSTDLHLTAEQEAVAAECEPHFKALSVYAL